MASSIPIDREDFLARFMTAQPLIRSYIHTLIGHEADVDDVMQEVSLTLWREFGRYDPSRPFIGWAIGIARNHVARWRTAQRTSRRRFSAAAESALATAYEELEDNLAERRGALSDCMDRLGTQAREILDMRYQRGLTLVEIAALRGSSLNAINKALGKIRRLLIDCAGQAGIAS